MHALSSTCCRSRPQGQAAPAAATKTLGNRCSQGQFILCRTTPSRLPQRRLHIEASTTVTSPTPKAPERAAASDPRKALRVAIADQLTGPHFDTWLDPSRFDPDRLVIQARRLWYYSTLLAPDALGSERQFTPAQLEKLDAAVAPAFADLQKFRLPSGGWRFSLQQTEPQVLMYGVGFALYALSTYFAAKGDEQALELANELFDNIEKRLMADGGVFPEAYELDFITPLGANGPAPKNALGHFNDRRSVNTHIHLLETLTAYHTLVPSAAKGEDRHARSAAALKGAADLVVALKDGPRMLELRDARDAKKPAANLRPPNAGGEQLMFLPGHNAEATFLVNDAYEVLGMSGPPSVSDGSFTREILQEAQQWMQTHVDPVSGERLLWLPHICVNTNGVWAIGKADWAAAPTWWAQMELLNALVHADQRLGGPRRDEDTYISRAADVWSCVSARFVNPSTGALYETLDGSFKGVGPGYGPWKASYHTTRALVRSLQALCSGYKGLPGHGKAAEALPGQTADAAPSA